MPKHCIAFGCTNHNMKEIKVSFHVFPVDPTRRERWVAAVRRINPDGSRWEPSKHAVLCGDHFITGLNIITCIETQAFVEFDNIII